MAHLYIASHEADPGILKVGRSNCPHDRARQLESGSPFRISIVTIVHDAGEHEAAVHRHLAHSRVGGPSQEWFRTDVMCVLEAIAAVMRHEPARVDVCAERQQKARAPRLKHEARRVLDECIEVPFLHATPYKTICDVMQAALGLRRRVVEIVLADAGVRWHRNGYGHRVAAREGQGLQLTSEARAILRELAAARVG
jgi:hypothetical protein